MGLIAGQRRFSVRSKTAELLNAIRMSSL
jgi:hypothetical protein